MLNCPAHGRSVQPVILEHSPVESECQKKLRPATYLHSRHPNPQAFSPGPDERVELEEDGVCVLTIRVGLVERIVEVEVEELEEEEEKGGLSLDGETVSGG